MFIGVLLCVLTMVEGRGPRHPMASGNHHHPHPSSNKKLLQDEQLLHDKQHIAEDLGDWANDPYNPVTDEEMEFQYFKAHDFDNNTKLDGLEIYQAIKHSLETSSNPNDSEMWAQKELIIVGLIDQVLNDDDINKDGYLSYAEYIKGREREKHRKQ